jgi:hypothetical protein
MVENYEAQMQVPFLMIPLVMLDNEEYLNWMGTLECKVWHRMYRFIVRAPMITKLNQHIHERYYKNGILAMYKEQKDISDFFGNNGRTRIINSMKSMADKKIIIKHADKWNGRAITIYELGTQDMGLNKHETIHLYNYFAKYKADFELSKMAGK